VFIHAERDMPGGIEWVAGLRHDRYRIDRHRTESQTSPKLAVAWSPDPHVSLRLAWGAGFRIPSFAERYTDNQEFFPIVRNLDLLPERSRSMEGGVRLRNAWARLDASVFSTTYDDLVEPRLVPSLQAFQFVNVSRANILGTEITSEVRGAASLLPSNAAMPWQLEAGYTWLHTEDAASGEPLPFRARHLLHVSGTLHPLRRLTVGAAYRYVSRPDRVDTDFARFVTDADLMVATHLLDVSVGWSGRTWRITLNTDNALAYAYVERPAYFGVPRHWSLRLDWTF
jgi:iron complex outermembrane receptor protein